MAMQLHVAHSARIRGVGLFAGPAYSCALDNSIWNYLWANSNRALGRCMKGGPEPVPVEEIVVRIRRLADLSRIDPVQGLTDARAWLLSGDNDQTVRPAAMAAVEAVYRAFARAPENVTLNRTIPVGHGWPTPASDSNPGDGVDECATTQPPFFNPCRSPATSEMLRFLLRRDPAGGRPPSKLIKFDQKPFRGGSASATGIGDTGFLCVPQPIDANTRVHIALHGCCQSAAYIGDLFPIETGLADAAAAFNLAILFPQSAESLTNPKGCWDWWGYNEWTKWRSDDGFDFPTRCGAQIRAIMAMVGGISGEIIAAPGCG